MKARDPQDRLHGELERRINDAADGLLDEEEVRRLEEDLKPFPHLRDDFGDLIRLPDLSKAYGNDPEVFRNAGRIARIRELLDTENGEAEAFGEITVTWFRKYALAAAVVIFGLISLDRFMLQPSAPPEMAVPELLYPAEQSRTEAYVIYLDELIEP